jgi:hypothetical protein
MIISWGLIYQLDQYQALTDKEDAHSLKIARLDHEMAERAALLKKAELLEQEKKQTQLKLSDIDGLIQKMQMHLESIKSVMRLYVLRLFDDFLIECFIYERNNFGHS